MRKQTITEDQIIEQTIKTVAQIGLENITTKKVAVNTGISEGSIFNYFKNKQELLTNCLYYIDGKLDELLKNTEVSSADPLKSAVNLWQLYYTFMAENGNYARFYRAFRHSSYYTESVIEGQDKSFDFFSAFANGYLREKHIPDDIFWVFVIETTLNFAVRISDGRIENTPETRNMVLNLIMNGITGFLKA